MKTYQQTLDKFKFFDGEMAETYYVNHIKVFRYHAGLELLVYMESNDLDISLTVYVSIEPPRLDRHHVALFGTNAPEIKISGYANSTIIKKVRPVVSSVPSLLFGAGVGEYELFSFDR